MIRRRLGEERGIALVMALLVMVVSSAVLVSVIEYTSSSGRDANSNHARQVSYGLAEAGINNALAVLNQAADPKTGTLLPGATETYSQGTAYYSGVYNATLKEWLITAVGTTTNPTGGSPITRTLTRKVILADTPNGPSVALWSRYYDDDNTVCLDMKDTISGPLATRGNLCLKSVGKFVGSKIWVGGNVTLDPGTSIGVSGTPIELADIAGTCKYSTQTANTPCSATDRVYATSIPTTHENFSKPTVDFDYWYNNAKPGPKYPCTPGSSSGTPPTFDGNTTYDASVSEQELTPNGSSYVCKVVEAGVTVGELSWNHSTKVLTIKGTIFIDGDAAFKDDDQLVNYQGRAMLYLSRKMHFDEVVCAGGSGTTNCRTAGMSSWAPATNHLVLAIGGKITTGNVLDFHKRAAFQGTIWATRDCKINEDAMSSGPLICNKLNFDVNEPSGAFFTWPPLGTLMEGQTHGTTPIAGDSTVTPSTQSG